MTESQYQQPIDDDGHLVTVREDGVHVSYDPAQMTADAAEYWAAIARISGLTRRGAS